MRQLSRRLRALVAHRDRGATAAEYALLITFIAVALIAAVTAFRAGLGQLLQNAITSLSGGGGSGAGS